MRGAISFCPYVAVLLILPSDRGDDREPPDMFALEWASGGKQKPDSPSPRAER